jgi:hypothetical protein
MTTTGEQAPATTSVQQAVEKMLPGNIVPSGPSRNDTSVSREPQIRSVPSSRTQGTTWLRYVPREPTTCECSTEV